MKKKVELSKLSSELNTVKLSEVNGGGWIESLVKAVSEFVEGFVDGLAEGKSDSQN